MAVLFLQHQLTSAIDFPGYNSLTLFVWALGFLQFIALKPLRLKLKLNVFIYFNFQFGQLSCFLRVKGEFHCFTKSINRNTNN